MNKISQGQKQNNKDQKQKNYFSVITNNFFFVILKIYLSLF